MFITPKCYGRYANIDPSSYIVNDISIVNIQPEWLALVDELIKLYLDNEPNLHSIYIRGSVADSRAINGISDLDSMAIIDTDQHVPMLESVCIHGNDLIPLLPSFKVGDAAAYSHSKNLVYDLDYIRKKLAVDQSPENVKTCCKKIMKRIVRSAMEVCMDEQKKYTRDLFLSSEMFSLTFPNDGVRIELAMHYALNPISNYGYLLYALDQLGDWLVDLIKNIRW